jgi:hypothetical protein
MRFAAALNLAANIEKMWTNADRKVVRSTDECSFGFIAPKAAALAAELVEARIGRANGEFDHTLRIIRRLPDLGR